MLLLKINKINFLQNAKSIYILLFISERNEIRKKSKFNAKQIRKKKYFILKSKVTKEY
jgi:hypothetical protein